ncbi:MAG: hypothetical protein ACLFVU_08190 [Phycisphaerae bacterium]
MNESQTNMNGMRNLPPLLRSLGQVAEPSAGREQRLATHDNVQRADVEISPKLRHAVDGLHQNRPEAELEAAGSTSTFPGALTAFRMLLQSLREQAVQQTRLPAFQVADVPEPKQRPRRSEIARAERSAPARLEPSRDPAPASRPQPAGPPHEENLSPEDLYVRTARRHLLSVAMEAGLVESAPQPPASSPRPEPIQQTNRPERPAAVEPRTVEVKREPAANVEQMEFPQAEHLASVTVAMVLVQAGSALAAQANIEPEEAGASDEWKRTPKVP